jgi:fructosamine-3-kinase
MDIPPAVRRWLAAESHGEIQKQLGVPGGCINNGSRLTVASGTTFFLKTNDSAPTDMFEREASGLALLAVPGGPRVPQVHLWGHHFILLEDLAPRGQAAGYWENFGRQLARLHQNKGEAFGCESDNYIGSSPQPNPRSEDGFDFFARYRLGFQARMARSQGLLSEEETGKIMQLAGRLTEWIPQQAPSVVHGDLWMGNMISDNQGQPAMIDPAAHYGWPETDLAMTALFGKPPDRFYRAYEEIRPLAPDFWSRAAIYNLYHLLNHLNLFGSGYYGQVMGVVRRFS